MATNGDKADEDETMKINVADHVAVRRAYDDATVNAVVDAGYDEDHKTVDAKLAFQTLALVIACVAHVVVDKKDAVKQWVCVWAYVAALCASYATARWVERDALLLTVGRGTSADGAPATKTSQNARCKDGLCVKVKFKRFDERFAVIVSSKSDRRCVNEDVARVEIECGAYVTENGEFLEDEYEDFVWKTLEAFECGKGRGVDVDISSVVSKMR